MSTKDTTDTKKTNDADLSALLYKIPPSCDLGLKATSMPKSTAIVDETINIGKAIADVAALKIELPFVKETPINFSPPKPTVAVPTLAPREWGTIAAGDHKAKGRRLTMEDETIIIAGQEVKANPNVAGPISFFSVLDGHGGDKAVLFTKNNLFNSVKANLENPPAEIKSLMDAQKRSSVEVILDKSFVDVDTAFLAQKDAGTSGTCVVAFLMDHASNKGWIAHAGDCRAVLCREGKAITLTLDHKADRPDEIDRIRKAGGFVIHKRIMGELAVSRAIGDGDYKPADAKMVIANPETKEVTFSVKDEFMVLMCDGLTDVMTDAAIVTFVKGNLDSAKQNHIKAKGVAMALTEMQKCLDAIALKLVMNAIDKLFTRDNTSVVIIALN